MTCVDFLPRAPCAAQREAAICPHSERDRDPSTLAFCLGATETRQHGGTSPVFMFAGTRLLLVTEGGPTVDKPTVTFAPPASADIVSHELTIRVTDCRAAYETLKRREATFLTVQYDWEIRCFFGDPDGNLLEISQSKAPPTRA
jgi:hypothetical protein